MGAAAIFVGVSVLMWAAGIVLFKTRILRRWVAWFSFLLALAALLHVEARDGPARGG